MAKTPYELEKNQKRCHYKVSENEVINEALEILQRRMKMSDYTLLSNPTAVRDYLRLKLMPRKNEVFCVVFLDSQHRVIKYKELFYGTIDSASVHPRVVVQKALRMNAAAVIFAHNHPSGVADPSQADKRITKKLKATLELVDIRVLDHLIVGEESIASFAELGLL